MGELYPASTAALVMAQMLQYVFWIGLFLVFGGEWLFASVLPSEQGLRAVRTMKANQMWTMIFLFAINMYASSLTSTGAFEVWYNDQLVHSKLATGHAPDVGDMLRQFKAFDATAQITDS